MSELSRSRSPKDVLIGIDHGFSDAFDMLDNPVLDRIANNSIPNEELKYVAAIGDPYSVVVNTALVVLALRRLGVIDPPR